MILTTHALIGAAVGKNIANLWLIPFITIPLHFLMDHLRHGDYLNKDSRFRNTWWKITLDLFAGIIIVFLIVRYQNLDSHTTWQIIVGMFSAMLPDLLTALNKEFDCFLLNRIHDFHAWCHKYPAFSKERLWTLRNGANDIILSVLAIAILFL
ncbi:MAG TPA: hypothetical protein P5323_02760 [Candidatus Moranbacteria bacterium]|nr:hypothetical protein [Candidatus Moranbacteria bacterium]HRY28034.1 hypothetical protein [Candidatus Moranbacteria bacterium]HSA07891.1 hypothetical protein [Candidatus Moranbacteria bacterium]